MSKTKIHTAEEYAQQVMSGEVLVCEYVRLAVEFGMTPSSRSRVSAILNDNTPKDEFAEFEEIDE